MNIEAAAGRLRSLEARMYEQEKRGISNVHTQSARQEIRLALAELTPERYIRAGVSVRDTHGTRNLVGRLVCNAASHTDAENIKTLLNQQHEANQ